MKNITLLGCTGSIGRQTIDVVRANPDKLCIKALVAHKSWEKVLEQLKFVNPDMVVMSDEKAASELKLHYKGKAEILAGKKAVLTAATYENSDTVVGAMVGYNGLRPTLAAIERGKNIALANKETLVAAGNIVMRAVKKYGVSLTPVDSEHSAIFQSLRSGAHSEVKRLIITASGGPFRGKSRRELENVTVKQCLSHPTWSMGPKVTIDSSTLANKGLEVMEAHWLFNVPYDKINVLVHPQSIVHSLVEFCDGAVVAQLGVADMRLPIQYALSYPERFDNSFGQLDLVKCSQLTFEEPDTKTFPALRIAIACGKNGGTLPAVFNAANEEAVAAFLAGKIKYLDISEIIERTVDAHKNISHPALEDIESADAQTRNSVRNFLKEF